MTSHIFFFFLNKKHSSRTIKVSHTCKQTHAHGGLIDLINLPWTEFFIYLFFYLLEKDNFHCFNCFFLSYEDLILTYIMMPKNYLDLAAGIANMQASFIQCKRTHLGKKKSNIPWYIKCFPFNLIMNVHPCVICSNSKLVNSWNFVKWEEVKIQEVILIRHHIRV